jgi:hypothetical protein
VTNGEGFDFEEARRQFPDHWDENGWPASGSTWRARLYPQMRVRVSVVDNRDVGTMVYWDGDLEGLRRLFTYEPAERWNIAAENQLVYAPAGIDREGHWRSDTETLGVTFDRPAFGGRDTWHAGSLSKGLPFFEPVADWDEERDQPDGGQVT